MPEFSYSSAGAVTVGILGITALWLLGRYLLKTIFCIDSEVVVVGERSRSKSEQEVKTKTTESVESPEKTGVRRKKVNKTNGYNPVIMAGRSGGGDFSDPIYKEISLKNGEINRLNREQLSEKLADLNLDVDGSKEVLRKRLKAHTKKQMLIQAGIEEEEKEDKSAIKCPFDYILVIDFEATCEKETPDEYIHEIIEFPVVLLNTKTLKVEDEFHSFCQPVLHPKLSTFCTELTGITQEQVDAADTFPRVFQKFEDWMAEKKLGEKYTFSILTDGPWDIVCFLSVQCALSEIPFPDYARKYINIRNLYSNFYHTRRLKLSRMLEELGMSFHGREHSGLADSRNIKRILVRLFKDGCFVRTNATFVPSSWNPGKKTDRNPVDEKSNPKVKDDAVSKAVNQQATGV